MEPLGDSPLVRDGKSLIIAMDHGLERGPSVFRDVPERADPANVFEIATHDAVTGLAVQKGVAETYYPSFEDSVTLVAKLNGKTLLGEGDRYAPPNWDAARAADLGADAIGYTVYSGSREEARMFSEFRDAQAAARDADLPVVLWSYPRGQGVNDHDAPDVVAYAARIGLELGADLAKVKFPGRREDVEWAAHVSGELPLLMSGGDATSEEAFLTDVKTFMDGGGDGLTVGRNIWQREDPVAMLDKLERIVYEDAAVEAVL